MKIKEIDISEPLRVCLGNFTGARGKTREERECSLSEPFMALARKMIYGGCIRVGKEYAIFISKVEFYYHEEEEVPGDRLTDDIVYHRNGRFRKRKVPYFPIMTLHSHWSGFDITFEKEAGHYRASALIRQYVVLDIQERRFIKLRTSGKELIEFKRNEEYPLVGEADFQDTPVIDDRSTYLQYYLNGFSMDGDNSRVEWCDIDNPKYPQVNKVSRKNAPEHEWGFIFKNKKEYEASVLRAKENLLNLIDIV